MTNLYFQVTSFPNCYSNISYSIQIISLKTIHSSINIQTCCCSVKFDTNFSSVLLLAIPFKPVNSSRHYPCAAFILAARNRLMCVFITHTHILEWWHTTADRDDRARDDVGELPSVGRRCEHLSRHCMLLLLITFKHIPGDHTSHITRTTYARLYSGIYRIRVGSRSAGYGTFVHRLPTGTDA